MGRAVRPPPLAILAPPPSNTHIYTISRHIYWFCKNSILCAWFGSILQKLFSVVTGHILHSLGSHAHEKHTSDTEHTLINDANKSNKISLWSHFHYFLCLRNNASHTRVYEQRHLNTQFHCSDRYDTLYMVLYWIKAFEYCIEECL